MIVRRVISFDEVLAFFRNDFITRVIIIGGRVRQAALKKTLDKMRSQHQAVKL